MKRTYTITVAILFTLFSCKDSKETKKDEKPTGVSVQTMKDQGEIFAKLRELLPEKETASYFDSVANTYFSWAISTQKGDSTSVARTIVSCWDLTSAPKMLWMYADSMTCDKGVADIEAEYDSMKFIDFNMTNTRDIAIAYIMGCGGDNEKNKMYLTVVSDQGEQLARLEGYPISSKPRGGVDSFDLRYNTGLGHGKHAEGKIENYYTLDNYSPTNRKQMERLWRSALRHNIGMPEPVAPAPPKDSIK